MVRMLIEQWVAVEGMLLLCLTSLLKFEETVPGRRPLESIRIPTSSVKRQKR